MIKIYGKVLESQKIGSSAKVLWLRLFNGYGLNPFTGTYEEMAREMGLQKWTIRAQVFMLRDAKAMIVDVSNAGNEFKLIDPNKWS